MRLSVVSGFTLLAVLAARTASAQPDPNEASPSPPPEPETTPASTNPPPPPPPGGSTAPDVVPADKTVGTILPNMLPTRIGATVDVRLDYSNFDQAGLGGGDLFLLGLNVHGQYIAPQGYGAYLQMPYYYASADNDTGGTDTEQGLGNIELGGLYKVPQGAKSEILLRGGIALDSAGNTDSFLAPVSQISPRLYDAYTAGFLSNWLRAEGSFRHAEGNLRFGASAGFDMPFGGDDAINIDGIAKLAVSVGIEQPGVGFSVGYVMMQLIGSDSDDDNVSGLNVLVNFALSPATSLYGAFGLPDLENNFDEFDLWAVGAGIRAAIN